MASIVPAESMDAAPGTMAGMPLLVPLVIALVVVLAATMLWVWAGSIAHVRHGAAVAAVVALLAASGITVMVADASAEWAGWALLAASAVALAAGWAALARWGQPRRR